MILIRYGSAGPGACRMTELLLRGVVEIAHEVVAVEFEK